VRLTSQKRSTSNRLKPAASRFETHLVADAVSYRLKGKQADVNDIPGTVTKFIGMAEDKSLCDYVDG